MALRVFVLTTEYSVAIAWLFQDMFLTLPRIKIRPPVLAAFTRRPTTDPRQSELTERRQQDMIRNALMLRAEVIAVLRPFHADPAGHRPDPHARAAAPAGDLICRRPLGFDTSR